jgi:hypothetical protein
MEMDILELTIVEQSKKDTSQLKLSRIDKFSSGKN